MNYLKRIVFLQKNTEYNSPFVQRVIGLLMAFVLFGSMAIGQNITVSGVVTDASMGESLPGVNVIVKGTTTNGAITDIDGKYTITAPMDSTLVFSFIGYEKKEIAINGQSTINVQLATVTGELDEVVVIAYGTTTKSDLTGSVVALSSNDIKDITAPRVSGMLQGKVAGLYAKASSGRPGETATLNIRGKGSLSGTNAPLWVLDGVIMGNSEPNISPSDIENISVLKDAAATSLYGSLAANGVILIQTKKAKKGMSKVTVNATRGYTVLNTGNFSLMNSKDLYDYHLGWNTNSWFTEDLLNTDTDWMEIGTQTGVTQEYNVSYLGGTDKVSAYVSGTYYQEEGAIKGYDYDRFSAITNIDIQATEKLKIKVNLTGDYSNTKNQEHPTYYLYTYMPWDYPYLPDGSPLDPRIKDHKDYLEAEGKMWYGRDGNNYLYDLQYNRGTTRGNNLRANIGFDYQITDWLKFVSMNNIALGFGNNQYYTDPRSVSGQADRGSYTQGYTFSNNRFTNQMLRINKTFGKNNINALIAWEYSDTYYESGSGTGKGVAAGLSVLNTTAEAQSVSGYKSESAKQNYMANVQFVHDKKYMATASFSRQGSSSFGPNNRYGNFWSASAGWNIHNEDFMFSLPWIDILKLTASFGQVGNAPGGFQFLGYYELTGQYNGATAARPYQKGNADLQWEKVSTSNIGLNTRLFNRISLNAEFYTKDNDRQLAYVRLPAMTGYNGYWANIGRMKNTGYEISITPEILKSEHFGWNMTLNLAYNKNEVMSLNNDEPYNSGSKRIEVGYDMDSWYQRIWYGVDPGTGLPLWEQVTEDEDGNTTTELTSVYADATLQHTNKKGTPTYTGGIINNIRIYDFNISANFGFVQGIYLYHSDRELFDSDGSYPTFNHMNLADNWSRWEKPGDIATHPKPQMGGVDANKNSSRYLEDASYLRLRNVTVSYQLPKDISERLKLNSTSVYLSADNMLTLSKWSGMDPETGQMYPLTKKIMAGIKIEF